MNLTIEIAKLKIVDEIKNKQVNGKKERLSTPVAHRSRDYGRWMGKFLCNHYFNVTLHKFSFAAFTSFQIFFCCVRFVTFILFAAFAAFFCSLT